LQTSDGATFVRLCHEPTLSSIGSKWIRFAKGGGFRKWYGNVEHLVNWEDDGAAIKEYVTVKYPYLKGNYALVVKNESTYFLEGLLTSRVTSGNLSFRIKSSGEIYADACTAIFPKEQLFFLSLLSTKLLGIIQELNPTLNFQASDIEKFPIVRDSFEVPYRPLAQRCIELSEADWDSYETSWDFTSLPLLKSDYRQPTIKATYQKLRAHWQEMTLEMQRLEEENNRIFIEAYGLQDELTPEVPLNEITLTCNPHYRYGNDKSEEELEALLLADTMRELVSYAVGCMFGRYALEKPGLILANQGETIEDYYKILNRETREKREKEENNFSDFSAFRGSIAFPADEDNVIPMLDGDWFTDDISERFKQFLKVAFGPEHYEENLRFVENALGKDIRKYFLKDFYTDHVKRYKKRPIYWLFSSPKGSFNALIYMHRYRPDTVSVVLNDYLREFRTKLTSHKNHLEAVSISASSSQGEKTKALKEIEKITKMIAEMEEYEREVLYPLATEQVEIDLDDGVKVNYPKFGKALKNITGLI